MSARANERQLCTVLWGLKGTTKEEMNIGQSRSSRHQESAEREIRL